MSALPEAPTTLPAFQRMFPNEDSCRDYLFRVRWPDGFVCPKCGSRKAWLRRDDRDLMECSNGHLTSVTAGTIMHRSKLPICTWFHAAYLVTELTPGISALQFAKQMGFKRYETAYQLLHKLRAALVAPDRERLKGEVEIDEQFIGGEEEGHPGRGSETKALVVCAVEIVWWFEAGGKPGRGGHEGHTIEYGPPEELAREHEGKEGVWRRRAGRVRLSVIPDASGSVLLPWVQENVEHGTIVYTDGWSGYIGLDRLGYTHRRVFQKRQGVSTGRYLPLVHLIISNVKRWWLGTHKGAISPKHLPAYLNEFAFRFNRRFWRGPAFLRALGLAMQAPHGHPEYRTLYEAGEEGGWEHPNPRRRPVADDQVEAVLDGLWLNAPSDALREWFVAHRSEIHDLLKGSMESHV